MPLKPFEFSEQGEVRMMQLQDHVLKVKVSYHGKSEPGKDRLPCGKEVANEEVEKVLRALFSMCVNNSQPLHRFRTPHFLVVVTTKPWKVARTLNFKKYGKVLQPLKDLHLRVYTRKKKSGQPNITGGCLLRYRSRVTRPLNSASETTASVPTSTQNGVPHPSTSGEARKQRAEQNQVEVPVHSDNDDIEPLQISTRQTRKRPANRGNQSDVRLKDVRVNLGKKVDDQVNNSNSNLSSKRKTRTLRGATTQGMEVTIENQSENVNVQDSSVSDRAKRVTRRMNRDSSQEEENVAGYHMDNAKKGKRVTRRTVDEIPQTASDVLTEDETENIPDNRMSENQARKTNNVSQQKSQDNRRSQNQRKAENIPVSHYKDSENQTRRTRSVSEEPSMGNEISGEEQTDHSSSRTSRRPNHQLAPEISEEDEDIQDSDVPEKRVNRRSVREISETRTVKESEKMHSRSVQSTQTVHELNIEKETSSRRSSHTRRRIFDEDNSVSVHTQTPTKIGRRSLPDLADEERRILETQHGYYQRQDRDTIAMEELAEDMRFQLLTRPSLPRTPRISDKETLTDDESPSPPPKRKSMITTVIEKLLTPITKFVQRR